MPFYWQVAQFSQLENGIVGTKAKHEPEDHQGSADLLACACGRSRDQSLKSSTLVSGIKGPETAWRGPN